MAEYLNILPLFLMIFLGMISRAIIYPGFQRFILLILLMAGMLAAIMSSLTSIFNSAGTMDLWHRFRAKASERELLIVGRSYLKVSKEWSLVINVNAVIGLVVVTFLLGYFA